MKKLGLIVIALILAVGVVVYVMAFNEPTEQSEPDSSAAQQAASVPTARQNPESPKTETVSVTYSDNGFSPQEITITKGSTVNFVNKASMPLWVASDPHPTHTDYPEFDTMQKRDSYPDMGENYSFTFNKVGTWKYHSHTASGDGTNTTVHPGTITVK